MTLINHGRTTLRNFEDETGHINITISEQVVAETERAIARKLPGALEDLRQAILASKARIVRNPSPEEVQAHPDLISHPADTPIVLAAMRANVHFLVTLNRKHFLDEPGVREKAGLKIGTPGEVLGWVRERIAQEE